MSVRDLLAILVAVGIFALGQLTIPRGHSWGDDFAQYLNHAKNLASGRDYATLDFIRNPDRALGPANYPPGLPLLLALPYRLVGPDIATMQVLIRLSYGLAIVAIYAFFRAAAGPGVATAVATLFAASPRLWHASGEVDAYGPHLLFLYLALYFCTRAQQARLAGGRIYLGYGTPAAACLYAASLLRTTGSLLLPALLLERLFATSGRWLVTIYIVAAATAMLAVSSLLFPRTNYWAYLEGYDLLTPIHHAVYYLAAWYWFVSAHAQADLVADPHLYVYAGAVTGLMVILALLGLVATLRDADAGGWGLSARRLTVKDWFFAVYMGVICLYPPAHVTYLVPVFPIFLSYMYGGVRLLAAPLTAPRRLVPLVPLLCLYLPAYWQLRAAPFDRGIFDAAAIGMFAYVQERLPADAVIIFRKPRALALLTGRRASIGSPSPDPRAVWDYIDGIGATHIIVDHNRPAAELAAAWAPDPERGGGIRAVYENPGFLIYEIVPPR